MQTPTQAPQGPPPVEPSGGPPLAPPAVLRRRASRRFVAGVAGGLADYYRTRPIWFRLLFGGSGLFVCGLVFESLMDPYQRLGLPGHGMAALLSLLALAAAAGYFLLWWLVPREDLPESAMQRLSRRYPSARRWPGLALLGLGLVFLLDRLSVWRADVVLAFALIAGGVLLYRRAQDPVEGRPELPPPGPALVGSPPSVVHALPPRERSALGWMTLGVAMLVVGGAIVWTVVSRGSGAVVLGSGPAPVTFPALGLLVLGCGLVVGAVFGRARWLIVPALLLVPVVIVASAIRLPLEGRFGDQALYPSNFGELVGSYGSTAGSIFIDLTRIESQHAEIQLSATTVIGNVMIVVPYDAHVSVEGYSGFGDVSLLGGASDHGLEASAAVRSEPRHGDGNVLTLRLETGIGNVAVYREAITRHQLRQLQRAEHRQGGGA